jgi:soluble calcium-activated nucleotidase 1
VVYNFQFPPDSFTWSSYLKTGGLVVHRDGSLSFKIDNTVELTSYLSEKGRGAELSELIVFNGRLYTVDDRSGISEYIEKDVQWNPHL